MSDNNFCGTNGIAFSSKKMDWETPQWLFDKLDSEFHFNIDICASDENAKCDTYFTEQNSCLDKSWSGYTCFMNPPYGRHINDFIKKAYEESKNGATVVCLIPSRTDTKYWHDYIFGKAHEIRFIKGRLKFSGHKNSAPFPSAIIVFDGEPTTHYTTVDYNNN